MTIFFTSIIISPPKLIIAQGEKGEKQMISEKDIDEFLRFRNMFTALEWSTINNYVEIVLEDRKRNFVLSESELEHVRNLIKQDKFI